MCVVKGCEGLGGWGNGGKILVALSKKGGEESTLLQEVADKTLGE